MSDAQRQRAIADLFDRHADHVSRVLTRILGLDPETPDLIQEVFLRAFRGIDRVRGAPEVLPRWLTGIAVYVAREHIRRKRGRWWLRWAGADEPLPDPPAATASPDVVLAVHRVRSVIERLPVDERIPFALRYLDDMELEEVADACDVSLATIKRRLARARARFDKLAARDAILLNWVEKGRP
ncbi:RNA polymerase sigma factor [Nannocystis pusilla]|uniref:RNA polymerase sigma factor n=1 Tax=Nannocystis pusilla TaxID=889268 RepID=UPI003BF20601